MDVMHSTGNIANIFKEKKYLLSRPCAECDRSYSEIYNTFVRKKPPLSVPGHTVFADTNG